LKHLYTPPALIKKLFSGFIWESNNDKILLSFDDGPAIESTRIILKTLSEKKIKAAFFCVGKNVSENLSLTKEILDEGHLIGNHTFNHKRLTTINNRETNKEIDDFNILLKEKFNYDVIYFRPPYGRFTISTQKTLERKNMKCVMWSLLTEDYKNSFETVKFAVENYLRKNSIVVLHDNVKSKNIIKDSINFIIDEAYRKGFDFGSPAESLL